MLTLTEAEELLKYLQCHYSWIGATAVPEPASLMPGIVSDYGSQLIIVGSFGPVKSLLPPKCTFTEVRDFAITSASLLQDLTGAPHWVHGNFTIGKHAANISLKGLPARIDGTLTLEHLDQLGVENWLLILRAQPQVVISDDSVLALIMNQFLQTKDYLQFLAACTAHSAFAELAARLVPTTAPTGEVPFFELGASQLT